MPAVKKSGETIGDWTPEKLARFIASVVSRDPSAQPPSFTGNEVRATGTLIAEDQIQLSRQSLQYIKDNLP